MKGNKQIELKAQRYLYERAHLSGSCVVTTFDPFDLKQAFIDGAEWKEQQFRKIENYQEEGWYSSGDDEYVYGISFDEPVKLPVEFYVKKK